MNVSIEQSILARKTDSVQHKPLPHLTTNLGIRRGFRFEQSPSVEKSLQSPLIDVGIRPREPLVYCLLIKRAMARFRSDHLKKLLRGLSPLPAFHPLLKMRDVAFELLA